MNWLQAIIFIPFGSREFYRPAGDKIGPLGPLGVLWGPVGKRKKEPLGVSPADSPGGSPGAEVATATSAVRDHPVRIVPMFNPRAQSMA